MGGRMYHFCEFFSGAGMVRLALAPTWSCCFANDIDKKKSEIYKLNFNPGHEYYNKNLSDVPLDAIPDEADLAWSSFPCQDLSLAGQGHGLNGKRSSAYWYFWRFVEDKYLKGNPFPIVAIENVAGLVTSNDGKDFKIIIELLQSKGYFVGAFILDAALFVPQSRKRIFIIAVHEKLNIPSELVSNSPDNSSLFPKRMIETIYQEDIDLTNRWVWWRFPLPEKRRIKLDDIIEWDNSEIDWHKSNETEKILSLMSSLHRSKVEEKIKSKNRTVGTIYRRTRIDSEGNKVQRAEVRFDGISGALRTPLGGSSRQIIIIIKNGIVRTRLLTTREAARLMGIPDSYRLPAKYNEAYHLLGDGVVVDVVRWIATYIMEPIMMREKSSKVVA